MKQSRRSDLAFFLGRYQPFVEKRVQALLESHWAERLFQRDWKLFSEKPLPELKDRLGWLELPESSWQLLEPLSAFASQVKASHFQKVVLLGMGGASLAPEVFFQVFGSRPHYPDLLVLDTTHPDAIAATLKELSFSRTLFLVSSKSGTTLETLSLFRFFWEKGKDQLLDPAPYFAVISDPGSPLTQEGVQLSLRKVFQPSPDFGGRFSALSEFGLVPAALIGLDLASLLRSAREMKQRCASVRTGEDDPCFFLGAALAELARAGRDKITFFTSPSLRFFPYWLEQLLAESLGKEGKGLIPVVDEPRTVVKKYGSDRFFVFFLLEGEEEELEREIESFHQEGYPFCKIVLKKKSDIGGEIFRWEVAVAIAGALLGVHPFNQPDVQRTKTLTEEAMEKRKKIFSKEKEEKLFSPFFSALSPGRYFAVQAYLSPTEEIKELLQKLRGLVLEKKGVATTAGFGPRFLHSTGQLHKGGPGSGFFLQLLDLPSCDFPVPGKGYSFAQLLAAQAEGDYQALKEKGRPVFSLHLGSEPAKNLGLFLEELALAQ